MLSSTEALTLLIRVHLDVNPITYGILRFRQLREGGAFWPGPRKQGYGYWIDLKFATNNGMDDSSKHAKFKVIDCSTFRCMTSQKFPFQKGTNHLSSISYPLESSKTRKNHFFCLKKSQFGTKLYPSPLCISMVFKQNKTFICSNF